MNDTINKLNSNIPAEAVEKREAWRGGPQLSYLSGAYVINRLNEVVGQGNWGYRISSLRPVFEGVINQANGEAFTVSYIATLSFQATVDGNTANFEEVGYGDGTDKKSQGKAHELATKEAVTDALKRAAKNLGISMGLGLYFKSQEYIDEQSNASESSKREENPTRKESSVERSKTVSTSTANAVKPGKIVSAKILKDQIKNSFAVLQAQKKITKEDFIKDYLNGGKTDDLDDSNVKIVLEKIKTNFPELGL